MKKPLATFLLILGGLAVGVGLGVLNMILFLALYPAGAVLAILAILAASFGIDCLRRLYKKKFNIKTQRYLVCAYVPSVLFSAMFFLIVLRLDAGGYFEGFMAGLGELVFGLSWMISSGAAWVTSFIWLMLSDVIHRKKPEEKPAEKDGL